MRNKTIGEGKKLIREGVKKINSFTLRVDEKIVWDLVKKKTTGELKQIIIFFTRRNIYTFVKNV